MLHTPESSSDFSEIIPAIPSGEFDSERVAYQPHELANLVFGTFWLSQGDANIQAEIVNYIVIHERQRISLDVLEEAFPLAGKRTARFIRRPDVHAAKEAGDTIDAIASQPRQMSQSYLSWINALHDTEMTDPYPSVQILAGGIVARDYKYLITENGRPRIPDPNRAHDTEFTRPYLSHFAYYGLTGHTTREPIFDQLFCDIVAAASSKWSDYIFSQDERSKTGDSYVGVLGELVQEITRVHFTHYPLDSGQLTPSWVQQLQKNP